MSPAYRLHRNASLRQHNTFGVEARAPWLAELSDLAALPELLARPELTQAPLLVLGGGSNLLFAGDAEGGVLTLNTASTRILARDHQHARVRAEAGMGWHALVMWSLQQGLSGLENLALIPGTVGAAPIQNIGAYGVEVGEFVYQVEAWDRHTQRLCRLDRAACAFAYRDSVFKHVPDRYIVTAVELDLPLTPALRLDYAGLGETLAGMGISHPTPREVADAVMAIRRRKLPDPQQIGNAGSFFKNPIVPLALAQSVQAQHPALPVFAGDTPQTRKISAAWMIEACGWKGRREGDAGVAASHALVLVNHGQASGAQLLALARRIAEAVQQRFGIAIEPEPRIIGAHW